jgi:hypothetical protein
VRAGGISPRMADTMVSTWRFSLTWWARNTRAPSQAHSYSFMRPLRQIGVRFAPGRGRGQGGQVGSLALANRRSGCRCGRVAAPRAMRCLQRALASGSPVGALISVTEAPFGSRSCATRLRRLGFIGVNEVQLIARHAVPGRRVVDVLGTYARPRWRTGCHDCST